MLTAVAPMMRAIFMSLAMVGTAWNGLLTATGAQESRSDVRWQSHTGLVETVVFQVPACRVPRNGVRRGATYAQNAGQGVRVLV